MFTLIRIKIILTDNQSTGNFPGDTVQCNIQNKTSCRLVFQLELLVSRFQRKHNLAHRAEAETLRTIHIFILGI